MSEWIPSHLPPYVITVTQRMTVRDAAKLMNPQLSAEAIALAEKLSGHKHGMNSGHTVDCLEQCEGCLADAAIIDRELQLPERNAALLLAQAVCDAYERYNDKMDCWDETTIGQLGEALKALKALT